MVLIITGFTVDEVVLVDVVPGAKDIVIFDVVGVVVVVGALVIGT